MKKIVLLSLLTSFYISLYAQGPEVIIPVPAEVVLREGTCSFEDTPAVVTDIDEESFATEEGYSMEITAEGVWIKAGGQAGLFYALRSLEQMTSGGAKQLRCCLINDSPRFPYRGLHVDVSRHFRSVAFLKKQMDAMALFKMNRMHLHLTDAAGWRIRIDAYPRLTQLAAWRPEALWKDWWAGDRRYAEEGTEGTYGGYYTREDIAELVEYAAQRHIEIIPEIEMPSHSEEVLAAYPELGCSGKPYSDSEFCVGNEAVFVFLETVLTEIMDMFPSEYIHIGGDEASMKHWETCPLCRKRMEEEGISQVRGLQDYLIRRMGRFIASKGRRMVGWDEIVSEGLDKSAVVMSWRGTEGGVKALSMGNDVVMTPGRYCYLDHAQDAPFKEPESIGGYLPIDSVYVYEPVEASVPEEVRHHLVGVQANLWSEYIFSDSHAEYMYWPRAFAIAETAWSLPENKSLVSFRERAGKALDLLRSRGYNVFDLAQEYGERKQACSGIRHKAIGCPVAYATPVREWYPASGETTFTDGIMGGWTYSDGRWQGFLSDIDVTIDLKKIQDIHYVGGTFMQIAGPGVFMPERVDISVSEDGTVFTPVAQVWNDVPTDTDKLLFRSFDTICDAKARYVRYHAVRGPKRGFVFLDEIVVN